LANGNEQNSSVVGLLSSRRLTSQLPSYHCHDNFINARA